MIPEESLTPFMKFQLDRYEKITVWEDPNIDPNEDFENERDNNIDNFETPEEEY